jgi:hypothetical protein
VVPSLKPYSNRKPVTDGGQAFELALCALPFASEPKMGCGFLKKKLPPMRVQSHCVSGGLTSQIWMNRIFQKRAARSGRKYTAHSLFPVGKRAKERL